MFTFVLFHHSPYSSGPHGYLPGEVENTDEQSGYPVRILTPLFMKYGVDAVISGHDEIWERSVVSGIEIRPDLSERANIIQFYDAGIGGDGLRGPEKAIVNTSQEFLVHTDVPEVWENGILKSGGKHYGHLEADILPVDNDTWQAILKPVYIFPMFDIATSDYSDYERRIYDDQIILTRHLSDLTVPVESIPVDKPDELSFSRSYPNPFSTETTIEYYLPEPCHATVKIFNMQGRILRILDDTNKNTGLFKTFWDGKDETGNIVPSGFYFYRIETTKGSSKNKQLIFLR
jgi:hypothetical protein